MHRLTRSRLSVADAALRRVSVSTSPVPPSFSEAKQSTSSEILPAKRSSMQSCRAANTFLA
jgi:hypothetical protein